MMMMMMMMMMIAELPGKVGKTHGLVTV